MFFPLVDKHVSYFKRFKMEMELYDAPPAPALPEGYYLVPWSDALADAHAEVMFCSFHDEIDAVVFPSLGDRRGCYQLMFEICRKSGFLPGATWLLSSAAGYCGTVQGVRDRAGIGAIQNLGVTPSNRGRGLGRALLIQALHGFRGAGLGRAFLEVTAQNDGAVQLYHKLGFRRRKTIYKAVDMVASRA
ncbi:MAG TPA: GNAT family N-acetyltransferase [Gemmataceae bacterium]|nr:GNAT family N-acetyltransferase [Gemmataceae bacterium]